MKENDFSLVNKTFLITGATSGIGLEICKQIYKAGGDFIGIGRNVNKLQDFIDVNELNFSKAVK